MLIWNSSKVKLYTSKVTVKKKKRQTTEGEKNASMNICLEHINVIYMARTISKVNPNQNKQTKAIGKHLNIFIKEAV